MILRVVCMVVAGLAWTPFAAAGLVTLGAAHDTTIYGNDGTKSNGGGGVIFAGTNSAGSPRRGLLAFDIAGSIPAGSTINSIELTLFVASFGGSGGGGGGGGGSTQYETSLHSVNQAWGEGTAGTGTGATGSGGGFETPNDDTSATWTHAFYESQEWTDGGSFAATASGSAMVSGSINSPFTWGSTTALVANVQGWLDNPTSNFGWILLGDESANQTFRSFYSREWTDSAFRPALAVTFTPVPEPSTLAIMAAFAGVATVAGLTRFRAHRHRNMVTVHTLIHDLP